MARLRRYIVKPDALAGLLTTGAALAITHDLADALKDELKPALTVLDGIPQGGHCVNSGYDADRDELWLTVFHESFENTPDGEILPRHSIVIRSNK